MRRVQGKARLLNYLGISNLMVGVWVGEEFIPKRYIEATSQKTNEISDRVFIIIYKTWIRVSSSVRENRTNQMRESLKDFFEGVSIKNTLFLIIWTAGILGWIYFGVSFIVTRAEANWTFQEVQKLQEQRKEINKTKDDVSLAPANDSVKPNEGTEEVKISSQPSGEIEKLIYEVFGKDEYKTARAVAFAESRLNPNATNTNTNGSTDCGVFQVNSIHQLKDCKDPVKNIEYAKQLFDRSGWRPWVTYTTGKYLAYL